MLEIEKYDIDFHSNNATLFTKDTEWYSEDKSKDTINGFAIGKACLARCESAPQLAPPRPRLNSISENNETDILKVSLHSNGYKPGYLGNKPSIQKLKLSKTFANDRMSNSIVEAEIVSSGSRKSGTVDAEKCFTNGNAPGVSIIDNDCNYHHCPSFTARQTTVVKDETKCTSISPINNRKSITEKKMPVSNLKQNDSIARHTTTISSCSSPVHKRYCTVNIGSSQNETLDSSFNCFSPDSLAINDEETEIKDLRTGVYNSINKFNEFISRRQQLEKLSTYPNDEAVIVHSPADPSNSILSEKGVCNIIVKDSKLGKDTTLKITEHENNLNSNISADSLNYTSNTTVTFHSDFVESPTQLPVPEGKTLSCDLKMSETDLLVNKQIQSYNQTCTKCGRVLNGIGKHKPTYQNSPLCAKNRDSQNNLSFSNGGKIQVTVNECISVVDTEQNPITSEPSSDNTSAARSRVDCDKYCEVCAKMCVSSSVDAPTLVNKNDATYILRSQTNNKSSNTGEQTEAVNLEDKTTVTFSSATQYLDVCHKQTTAKTNVVQGNWLFNTFNPGFLTRTLPSLTLDTFIVANSGFSQKLITEWQTA